MPKIALNLDPRTLPEARTILGQADARITELEAENIALLGAKPEDSQAFKDLKASLDTANTSLGVANQKVIDAEAKVSGLDSRAVKAETDLAAANQKHTEFEAGAPERANARAIELLAAKGLGPLAIGLPDGPGEKKKVDPTLKGRDRLAAAWNIEGAIKTE